MIAERESKEKHQAGFWFLNGYIYLTAFLLAGIGILLIYSAYGSTRLLAQKEVLFGVTNKTVLLTAGVLHLVLSGYLFAARNLFARGMMTLWWGSTHIFYYFGTVWLKPAAISPLIKIIGKRLHHEARQVDFYWKTFIGYLIVGSVLHLAILLCRAKQKKKEAFDQHWQEVRKQKDRKPLSRKEDQGSAFKAGN